MKLITLFVPVFTLNLLSACTNINNSSLESYQDDKSYESFWNDSDSEAALMVKKANAPELTGNNEQLLIHKNVTRLANSLFSSAKNIHLAQSVAVGTFLPIHLTNSPNLAKQKFIGLQIQESFITLATQAGLNVVEFKTASAIKIAANADVMLSRNIKELQSDINAQYFLTGTYSEHDNKLIVNARIIELANQKVIAAATDYIAMPSLQNKQKITIKDKMIYREAL
jgi:TolB-like protein